MSATDSGGSRLDDPAKRRTLKRIGVSVGAVATLGAGSTQVPRFSPVGRAQAVAPLVLYGAGAAGGAVVGWALGEWDPLESDSTPEGLTAGALEEDVRQTVKTRESENKSTFVDNRNIISGGLSHTLYSDGKVAAIEELNNQASSSEVETAAMDAFESHLATVQHNLLKSWDESVNELSNLVSTIESHSDVGINDVFTAWSDDGDEWGMDILSISTVESTTTLADGSEVTVNQLELTADLSDTADDNQATVTWDPTNRTSNGYIESVIVLTDSDVRYLDHAVWDGIWSEFTTLESDVRLGLSTWVDNVYGEVQSGELDTEDLLTPRELAEMSADEENVNQAIADLMALNIPVDLEREATISMQTNDGGTATMSGMLAPTDPPDGGIVSGETYTPADMSGDIYFNYDISQGSAEWTQHEPSVDGGIVTFNAEPYADTEYKINTAAGESATVAADDFEEDTSNGVWTVDISSQVDTAITDVESVEMTSSSGETQNELIQLENEFTVDKIENSDGEEVDQSTFSSDEPQDDENYISQEEWDQMQQRNQELIDKYEESKSGGSPGGSGSGNQRLLIGGLGALILSTLAAVALQGDN